jgi:GT2 family glycosyltransferase/LmbE family N-acetylglucosaminyl deacetylase
VTNDLAFDPAFRFLALAPFDQVPRGRVVCLAPHPDDEVIGCGGALARHVARGDSVVVVHVTDGAGAAKDAADRERIRKLRREESVRALAVLGVTELRGLDFPDGALRPEGAFVSGLGGLLETLKPTVIYAPSPLEHHPDHRATVALLAKALERSELRPHVILFEVNQQQIGNYLIDITDLLAIKERALRCFTSQHGELDITAKTLTGNRARTVNVDLKGVEAAEGYCALPFAALQDWLASNEALASRAGVLTREAPAAATGDSATTSHLPISAVISTWNKKDDVRENLLALARQECPPAEIVVVDNASKDGTAEMIRAEFPAVKLIVTPHDKIGACETFNMGFKAATQPWIAIMDDDVVAPPDWLKKLWDRAQREPETTAMVSSKVVEPGMPEEFLRNDGVNRERYMATFRGCGTLAKRDVVLRAGGYDEEFFIYGNERDLSARVLILGYRILQYPQAEIFHKTPFGMKGGKRSLYYHVRNFWLYAFKHCSWWQVLRAGMMLGLKGLGLRKGKGQTTDATGTIGIDKSIKETEGGLGIAFKATFDALLKLPYCLKHRQVCRHPDFVPPA